MTTVARTAQEKVFVIFSSSPAEAHEWNVCLYSLQLNAPLLF